MDARLFDALSRALGTGDTRRRVLGALATLPVLGGLLPGLDEVEAKKRNRRNNRQRQRDRDREQRLDAEKKKKKKKKKKPPACVPEAKATTCAGKCGPVTNTCGQAVDCGRCTCAPGCAVCCDDVCCTQAGAVCHQTTGQCCVPESNAQTCNGQCGLLTNTCGVEVDCGPCDCEPNCPICQVCNPGNGVCIADPDQQGDDCGGTPTCEDGIATPPDRCDASGACQPATPVSCAPYHCDGNACGTSCSNDTQCETGSFCDLNNACVPLRQLGQSCSWQEACESGHCISGVCCDAACDQICQSCTVAGSIGTCSSAPDGEFCRDREVCCAGTCQGCCNDAQCPGESICCGGSCTGQWHNQAQFSIVLEGSNGQYTNPSEVAIASDGLTAWVVDRNNSRVTVWTRPDDSSTVWSYQVALADGPPGGSNMWPASVAVAPDGRTVWIADTNNECVTVWTRPDATSTAWSYQTHFGSSGTIAVAPDGLTAWIAGDPIAGDPIEVWTRPNTSSTAWSYQAEFGASGGLAVSPDGLTVWVAESNNHRVRVWARSGPGSTDWSSQAQLGTGTLGTGSGQFYSPFGVAVAPDGLTVWIADTKNNRIAIWTRPSASSTDWTYATRFGSHGYDDNQFFYANDVAVAPDGQTAWVADYHNHRIAVWGRGCPE